MLGFWKKRCNKRKDGENLKRYFALVLSILMVLGTVAFPAGVSAESIPERKTVVKLDNAEIIGDVFGKAEVGTYQDGDSTVMAAKMAPGALVDGKRKDTWYNGTKYWSTTPELNIDTDMSDYQTINLRMYSKEATGETVNVILEGKAGWLGDYIKATFTVDWTGWKDVAINFDNTANVIGGSASDTQIDGVWFNFGGYNTASTGNANTEIAVSEIYLSNPWSSAKPKDGLLVYSFGTEARNSALGNITSDTAVTNMNAVSGKFVTTAEKGDIFITPQRGMKIDTQKYKYLNLLMYLDKSTPSGKINVCVQATRSNWSEGYVRKAVPTDWTGWKVVSIPLSEMSGHTDVQWNMVRKIKTNYGDWSEGMPETGTQINFDLIWFSEKDPTMTQPEVIAKAGDTEMPTTGAEVGFRFNNSLRSVDDTNITLTKAGETASKGVSYAITDDTVTLTATDELEYGASYTLTIPVGAVTDIFGQSNKEAVTYSFTTLEQGLNASLPTLTDGDDNPLTALTAGQTVKASTRVNNGLEEQKSATLVLAFYDTENRLVKCEIANKNFAANSVDTLEITTQADGTRVKAFVLDGLATLRPLCNGFAQVPAAEQNGGTQGGNTQNESLVLTTVKAEEDQLFIDGRVDGALPRMVVIAVVGEKEDNPLFLTPVMAEDGGGFMAETIMPDAAATGEYSVRVAARRIDGLQTDTFWFIEQEEREALREAVNASDTKTVVANILTANREKLELPADGIGHIAATVFEQKPYADYPAFTDILRQSQTVLEELNTTVWSGYAELLSKYPMILNGIGESEYYFKLNAERKALIGQQIVQSAPFKSFEAFRTVFTKAVADDIKNSGSQSGGTGNKGGSTGGSTGGRGGSSGSSIILPREMVPSAPGAGNEEVVQPQERFVDLVDAEWARESIERLYAMGAVASAEYFRPNDSIMREEFVKLLAEAVGLEKRETPTNFADVEVDEWYAPYIAAVHAAGIVNGYEDGRFGIGERITRQDMAAILYRTLEYMGVELPETSKDFFADDDEISSYARDAVYAMKQAGVINGVGDGRFAPAQNASRAQAVKMLCGLLDQLKK